MKHYRVRPKRYIDDYRIAHADRLRLQGMMWKDIAAYFGQSPSSFSEWYKRVARTRPF